jgi:ribonucleoside-diphosphate reductase alpha chain
MKIVNQTVPMALSKLGYSEQQIKAVVDYIDQNETIEGAPELKEEHLPVFDCAFKARKGERSIHYLGHIRMMGATQPFISGAISKTVNVPKEATVDEIMEAYIESWRLGAKAVSIYRDGSKRTQPLNTSKDKAQVEVEKVVASMGQPVRKRLPDERHSITHKFDIAGHEGYITVGLFEDGQPGELFLVMAKEGSTISGFADAFAQAISYALQYGVPLQVLVDKFSHARFEPSGMTRNPDIRFAKSIVDYIFRWLATKFLSNDAQYHAGVNNREERKDDAPNPVASASAGQAPAGASSAGQASPSSVAQPFRAVHAEPAKRPSATTYAAAAIQNQEDAPPCSMCGSIMVRSGSCYKCANCGSTSGCA